MKIPGVFTPPKTDVKKVFDSSLKPGSLSSTIENNPGIVCQRSECQIVLR
jgi:hypothetical protein